MRKGELSKAWIIENSVGIMNTEGVNLTLNQLATALGVSRGRISHYFKTKDDLFISIANEYEEGLAQLNSSFVLKNEKLSFDLLRDQFSVIMDHQFNYRCAIIYIVCFGHDDKDMSKHIKTTYQNHSKRITEFLKMMVKLGFLSTDILKENNIKAFVFEYINLFTTWVLHYNLYERDKDYKDVKPIYLNSIMQCFERYRN